MAPKNRAEYRKTVADAFIGVLSEKGLNWHEEWDAVNAAPQNAVTGSRYHGVNQFYLSILAMARGYTDPRWATMTQIMDKNGIYHKGEKWHLQAGSKAVFVEYWYPYDKLERKQLTWKEFRAMSPDERADDRYMLRVRYTPVFHASMIDGIAPLNVPQRPPQELSDIVSRLSQSMGVEIVNDGGSRAFYRRSEDKIHLPVSTAFHGEYEYNATALHELAHSTGHKSRLDRPMSGRFGSEEYAFEELIAEISSCFMSVDLDVQQMPQHLENHKAYVQNWIDAIKEKPEMLANAIAQAQRVASYMDFHAGLISEKEYAAMQSQSETVSESKSKAAPARAEIEEQTSENKETASQDVLGAYEVKPGIKTWPLDTEFGKVTDFRDYIIKSERSFGVNIRLDMSDDANEYVTALISEGKIRPGDAAYVAMYAKKVDGEWTRADSVDYKPGPYREAHLTTPDAAGMKKLLQERFPEKDFELQKDVDSKHVLLTEQMRALGYEPTFAEGFSDDFLMWKETTTGRVFGVDGWEGVQAIVEDRAELSSYVGKKVTWDGELYDVESVRDNRLSMKSTVTGYYREPTLSEFKEHGAVVSEELAPNEDTFSIYQLRRNLEPELRRDLSFSSMDDIKNRNRSVELSNYDCVYTGGLLRPGDTLDTIYEEFNLRRPDDFIGHSPSVSDLIVTVRDGVTQAFYVDSVGFQELPDISREIAELDSYVGAKIEWDGDRYEAIGTNGNRLILQSMNDEYHTEVTLAQLKLQEPDLIGEKRVTVQTNIGEMPLADYRDIVAQQHGYSDYADMRKDGLTLGNGYDDPPLTPEEQKPRYELIELRGKEMLLTSERLERNAVPEGWFHYELQGSDNIPWMRDRLVYSASSNFAGTIISPSRIEIPEPAGFLRVGSELKYADEHLTVAEFTERQVSRNIGCPQKNPASIQLAAEQACACYAAELSNPDVGLEMN